ncbi:MAG: hypothetical protein QG646_4432 [Euryarchaeota archaeon]|nr:hypothetical protein [Euryarchaeota archaeon]
MINVVEIDAICHDSSLNRRRMKKPLMIKNMDYIKANAFAFYSINGNNCIDFKDSSKAESLCEFLEKIVEENKGKSIVGLTQLNRKTATLNAQLSKLPKFR